MKLFKYQILMMLSLIFFSCQDDLDLKSTYNTNPNVGIEKNVENGRFLFSNKESLKATIENLQKDNISNLEREFEKLYEKGFRSHKPIINPENTELKAKLSAEILKRSQKNSTSDKSSGYIEGFINDPHLALLVNEDNEIIVNDTIYKFTMDKGLFFSHVKDSILLFNYLEKKENKSSMKSISEICAERIEYGGITTVEDSVLRYVSPPEEECVDGVYNGGTYGGGNSGIPPSAPETPEEETLQEIINNLPECDGNVGGNWVQGLFGKSYVCRNYFDSGDRIKTEFWDQRWLIYASVGVLTKTQTKTLGVWWASKSDEIHIGINRIFLKYKYNIPNISSISHPDLLSTSFKAPIYMYKGKFKVYQTLGWTSYVDAQVTTTRNDIPFFDFGDDEILNIYIPKLFKSDEYNINLTTQDITSQSNIKQLYKMGIDFLKDNLNSGAIGEKKFAITYQTTDEDIEVLYFEERYKKTNDNIIKKTFYKDVSFEIGAAWGESSGWSYSIQPASEFFRNYTHYEIDFYGMAKRGNSWKGNRLIR